MSNNMAVDKSKTINKANGQLRIAIILSLTLGLAPFFPEPHLWGKLKWVMGGAHGMAAMDYFDLIMHGFPWVFLIYVVGKSILKRVRGQD
tara:strand:- start:369 stop:638 length:270 start_codon:yes stop_codon:yes gene_type:complete